MRNKNNKLNQQTILMLILILPIINGLSTCHYTCANCTSSDYYKCTLCNNNRGLNQNNIFLPISSMCYCTNQSDQNSDGQCTLSNAYNYNNKAFIIALISLCLIIGTLMTIVRGMRYYLLKTIQDIQQLSLIVFINLYFPQQFDIFLTHLYRFNMSSFTFQSLTNGSLFKFQTDSTILSTDGQNIYGKYKLLHKSANFFSNSFTWIIAAASIMVVVSIFWAIKRILKNRKNENQHVEVQSESFNNSQLGWEQQGIRDEQVAQCQQIKKYHKKTKKLKIKQQSLPYLVIKRINNVLWLTIPITFFYFSLFQLNLNIFTQIANLTFSSSFAAVGAFFSALFMGFQFIVLILLFLKTRQQAIKPEWMRDHTYSPCIYLIRVNYKTITKYFFFISCVKKILFALFITLLYHQPVASVIGISSLQGLYILIAIYCEPFQRRHLRIHFYLTQGFKLFMYISLLNFSQKYVEYLQLIEVTQIFYIMLALIFCFHLAWIIFTLIVERKVYWHYLKKKFNCCCKSNKNQTISQTQSNIHNKQKLSNSTSSLKGNSKVIIKQNINVNFIGTKIGYHSEGKIYIYERQ